jgi:superoxide dismutase
MDAWEHSYYRDYLSDRKTYVFAMMRELRWTRIEERFEKAERISKVMR